MGLSLAVVTNADESRQLGMAGRWRGGVVDAVGDGLGQVAGEGGPCWR